MRREIELKLEVAPDAIEALLQQPWLKRAGCKSTEQVSTYYDTTDDGFAGGDTRFGSGLPMDSSSRR